MRSVVCFSPVPSPVPASFPSLSYFPSAFLSFLPLPAARLWSVSPMERRRILPDVTSNAVSAGLDEALRSLSREGRRLGFVLIDVPRDGQCLYSAVLIHHSVTSPAASISELRLGVYNMLQNLPAARSGFVPNNGNYGTPGGVGYPTWNDYASAVKVVLPRFQIARQGAPLTTSFPLRPPPPPHV